MTPLSGVPHPIAPLIAPMVDLSVVGLLVALCFLALRGVPKRELKPVPGCCTCAACSRSR
ncbi:hypothetical protein ACFU5B_01065 [Streptomyces murinus]|uniref:hypothetical protein n=1 Tax=Streptomyces murinus TaxID=33900 RepID=UPI00363FC56A